MRLIALASLLTFLSACTSSTLIRTNDPEVNIYADGQFVGKGAGAYSDTKIVGSTTKIYLRKKGCQEQIYTLTRSESFEIGPCIGGAFILVPFLWVMGYNPNHNYEFQCEAK